MAAARRAAASIVEDGEMPSPLVVVGYRGVGKTVLLEEMGEELGPRTGWPTVIAEAVEGEPVLGTVAAAFDQLLSALDQDPSRASLQLDAVNVAVKIPGAGLDAHFIRPARTSQAISSLLDAGRALAVRSTGAILALDEMQRCDRGELQRLGRDLQAATRQNLPLLVILAGLPSLRSQLKDVTFIERATWLEVGNLSSTDTLEALTLPVRDAGREFEPEALVALAEATDGYPYAIQLFGHHAWTAANGAARITLDHAKVALLTARQELEAGLFAQRWDQASPRQRTYMAALASLLGRQRLVAGGEVAKRLGQPARRLSSLRDRLIRRGTLVAEGANLRFPIPGMDADVRRRAVEEGLTEADEGVD